MAAKISVIIPTCKPQDYLWECLDSLERQTLDKDEFEVILVLNGPREPYEQDISRRLATHSFAGRLLYAAPGGVSRARNLGIEHAAGAYLTFVDDDDLVSPDYLELLLENKCEDGVTVSNIIAFRGEVAHVADHYLTDACQRYNPDRSTDIFLHRSLLSTSCCKLFPRPIVGDARFREDLSHGEDALFMFVASARIRRILLTPPEATYYVRKRDDSASRSMANKRRKQRMELRCLRLYAREYFRHPRAYSFRLFLSRLAATAYKLLLEDYVRPL